MAKDKIKVLYQVNIPSPYRVDFFNELGKMCDLTVLFERETSDGRDLNWHNYSFDNFRAVFLKGKKVKDDLALSFEVIKYLKRICFDIIVIGGYATPTGMLAIRYLRTRKIPFILNVDGGLIPKQEHPLRSTIKRHFIGSASYWLSTGKNTSKYLKHYGAKENNIFIYPFTTMFEKDVIPEVLDYEDKKCYKDKLNIEEDKMILTVGRFVHIKGFDVLLNVSKDLPKNYGVYFVGGEPTEEYLKLKEDHNLTNVHFIGFKSKEKLKEYYKASDLFVLPTREDIWGLVINEAMSFGLPIISTDKCVAGVELVKNYENGFIVPTDDSNSILKKINKIFSDKKLASKMSEVSLERSLKYTLENMAREHMRIFEKVLGVDELNEYKQ